MRSLGKDIPYPTLYLSFDSLVSLSLSRQLHETLSRNFGIIGTRKDPRAIWSRDTLLDGPARRIQAENTLEASDECTLAQEEEGEDSR